MTGKVRDRLAELVAALGRTERTVGHLPARSLQHATGPVHDVPISTSSYHLHSRSGIGHLHNG